MATIINLVCKECGKQFTRKKGAETMFCSKECKSIDQKRGYDAYIEKPCECCGIIFRSKFKENKKFCSYKCSGQNKKNVSRETKYCKTCGNPFEERIKRVKNFCSEKCIRDWQARPENIKLRLEKTKESIFNKYGVYNTFQVDKIRMKALTNLKNTFTIRGIEITETALLKVKVNREKKLINRFLKLGYKILEFKDENIVVQHPDGHIFENNRKLIVARLNQNVELSTILQPIGSPKTTFERRICKMLEDKNIQYVPNTRKVIKAELDIYIPTFNLAIEVNGLHWHSEYYLHNTYHLEKTEKCNKLGIELLHFFEDELLEKYNIIESIIKNKISLIDNKISVCDCIIKEIDSKTAKDFLEINHIEGADDSSIRLGLYFNNELISIMTFINNSLNGEYEILRYSDKINTTVVDGALKLYNYFKEKYNPINVIVFANRRFNNGNLYKKLGFEFECETVPNYWYIKGKTRKDKNLYTKNVLVTEGYDPTKTEHEIMLERKIPRIYDCGNIKYKDIISN